MSRAHQPPDGQGRPRARSARDAQRPPGERRRSARTGPGKRRIISIEMSGKVLVVEDDPQIREVIAEVLTDEGYAVQTAENGREALQRLHESRPCVMLLDLMMPIMDGWQLLGQLAA